MRQRAEHVLAWCRAAWKRLKHTTHCTSYQGCRRELGMSQIIGRRLKCDKLLFEEAGKQPASSKC